jgi:MFS family permease
MDAVAARAPRAAALPAAVAIVLVEVLAMGTWFGATAAAPQLDERWSLGAGGTAWLTGAVQLGFVAGALSLALLNLPDRMQIRVLIAGAAVGAALANLLVVLFADGLATAIPLRLATGAFLAGVYAPGLALMASWFRAGRGLALGAVVGGLTLGSASPHLVGALGAIDWRVLLLVGSAGALLAAIVVLAVPTGPFAAPSPPLDLRYSLQVARDRPLRLANLGYLGHMWELYAVWAWLPVYLAAALGEHRSTDLLAFAAIGVAGLAGCLLAGAVADRIGRTAVTSIAMGMSGACAALSAVLFGAPAVVLGALVVIWGVAVIADSAQFSASVSELCDRRYVGTALTLQTALGFLLTIGSIRLVGGVADLTGWRWAFLVLVPGPLLGIAAMLRLRALPEATRLAGGAR